MTTQEKTFTTDDGTELFYRYRPALTDNPRTDNPRTDNPSTDNPRTDNPSTDNPSTDNPSTDNPSTDNPSTDNPSTDSPTETAKPNQNTDNKKAIVLFHRGHEHSGRMMFIADELGIDDADYFAWDARGHGNSPGLRGDSPSIGTSVADVDNFIQHIVETYGIAIENIAIIAQSVSAVLISTWLHDYAPKIRCTVLATPAFSVKLYVPFARQGLQLMQKIRGNFFVNSYVKAHYLTHDKARIDSYNADPLIAKAISARILLGLYDAGERVVSDAAAITTPIQVLIAEDDKIVHHKPQHEFYNQLGSHIKERHILPNFYHDVLGEKDRHLAFAHIHRFISDCFAQPIAPIDVTQSHRYGFTRQEADKLSTPLPTLSPKGLYWATMRSGMKFFSRWSQGLKIGAETGYDSGSTLDYVYQNKPQGTNLIGKLIDKNYLNAIGWRGIRQRKVNIGKAIDVAMQKLRTDSRPIHVLDIASGHGRYIVDALTAENLPDSIRLRDYSPINVEAGRKLLAERNLTDIATFDQVDAYQRDNYADLNPAPTLGVVSGLHELFPDNDLIMNSLKGFGDCIEKGNYLIYTGQPYHPQLELIGRCLTSHREGQDWVMRRRTQLEMDQLVEKAGFQKIKQWIDEDGIFTVSLAVKV